MKISVLIIAHNEEPYIGGCIESILAQSTTPTEIVLVCHNSTDETATVASSYPIRVIEYAGPVGPAYARIRGFEEITGDMVLCIDGDAIAAANWIEVMSTNLAQPDMVMVGSWVKMSGTPYARLGSWRWYFFCNTQGFSATDWMWGASLGLWTRDREHIIEALKQGVLLSEKLDLPLNPDDLWLALFMSQYGNLQVTNKTWVTAHTKEKTLMQYLMRGLNSIPLRRKIRAFIQQGGVSGVSLH